MFKDNFWRAKYEFDQALENTYFRLFIEILIGNLLLAINATAAAVMSARGLFFLTIFAFGLSVAAMYIYLKMRREKTLADRFRSGDRLLVKEGDDAGPRQYQIAAYPHELQQRSIEDRVVRIADILNENGAISHRRFEHCTLIGPATIYVIGDVPKLERPFHNCGWMAPRWTFLESQTLGKEGCIESIESDYINCYFRDVVFRIKDAQIEDIKLTFTKHLVSELLNTGVAKLLDSGMSAVSPHTGQPRHSGE
jgi:hypothetical protein